jgi:hypothetical protein|tara:strand:- start:3263 stop:3691 length:429 start_codon:yes stop_codon:yes gene_type:complete
MANITLKAQRFNKSKFNETVNTEFTQLNVVPDLSFFDRDLADLDDFWYLYEKFFYIIPKLGLIESHEYLAKTSGEYADFNSISDEIQALLDEIAELRAENLQLIKDATNIDDALDPNEGGFDGTGRNQMENTPSADNYLMGR